MVVQTVTCPCGCGETFSPIGSRGRPRRFFSPGCSLRVNNYMHLVRGADTPSPARPVQLALLNPFYGRRHSTQTRAVLSEKASVPKPWLRGERNGMAGRTGELNPNWRGGSSPERQRLYSGAAWRKLRRQVLARSKVCEQCGGPDELHMHHVKAWASYPDLRLDPANIVLLCRDCHYDKHRKGGVRHQ